MLINEVRDTYVLVKPQCQETGTGLGAILNLVLLTASNNIERKYYHIGFQFMEFNSVICIFV